MESNQYMIRHMKEIGVGMPITFIGMSRRFDYIVDEKSTKGKCLVVHKQTDSRKHPRKMVLKNVPIFIKRGLLWADE